MKNILKYGINSNVLKTIAVIAMVIDHIGFYFSIELPITIYKICRYTGRIAMPIFVYLLVQGFFYTKNLTKYIQRISILAVITQILITILMLVNIKFFPLYNVTKQVYSNGNILFSFVISLVLLNLLHKNILIKKWSYTNNLILKMILVFIILTMTIIIPLDYGIEVVVLSTFMYNIEKIKTQLMIYKNNNNSFFKRVLCNSLNDANIKCIYVIALFISICTVVIYFNNCWSAILAIIPIALYNTERGKYNIKYIYYIIFPIHHILLYSIAMIQVLT